MAIDSEHVEYGKASRTYRSPLDRMRERFVIQKIREYDPNITVDEARSIAGSLLTEGYRINAGTEKYRPVITHLWRKHHILRRARGVYFVAGKDVCLPKEWGTRYKQLEQTGADLETLEEKIFEESKLSTDKES